MKKGNNLLLIDLLYLIETQHKKTKNTKKNNRSNKSYYFLRLYQWKHKKK